MNKLLSNRKNVECLCPRCHIIHIKKLYLADESKQPRIYCNKCKSQISRTDDNFASSDGGRCCKRSSRISPSKE